MQALEQVKEDVAKKFPKPLSGSEIATMTVYLIGDYAKKKGKPVTRFRIPQDVIWRGTVPGPRRAARIAEWKAALLSDWGWLAFETEKHFALIQAPLVKGWVLLGGKRFMETRQKLREGNAAGMLQEMHEASVAAAAAAAAAKHAKSGKAVETETAAEAEETAE
jgi:hypothetical protein